MATLAVATVAAMAMVLVPAATSSASPTTDTFYAYPSGTGTDCTSNTFTISDCDLTMALIAATESSADTVMVYLETTGTANEFINEAPIAYLTSNAQVIIEPSPTLSGNSVIDGSGSMSGNGIFTINGTSTGSVTINNVTLQNGDNGGLGSTYGGALTVQGYFDVTVNDCQFNDNESLGSGGAISFEQTTDGATLTVMDSSFTGNTAQGGNGGAIDSGDVGSATLNVSDSTFTDNAADQGNGGAIDSGDEGGTGSVTVTDSTFTDNEANADEIVSNGLSNLDLTNLGDGGALDVGDQGGTGTLSITDGTLQGNQAYNNGGAIDEGDYGGSVTGTVTNVDLLDNASGADGGAIDSGDSENGVAASTGNLTVTNSTLNDNVAYNAGGAIDSGDGGDILNGSTTPDVSTLGITDSTLNFNTSTTGAGGAIDSGDGDYTDDVLTISGSTFDGDLGGDYGGAIANADDYGMGNAMIDTSAFSLDNSTGNGQAGGAVSNATYNGLGELQIIGSTFDQDGSDNTVGGAIVNDMGGVSDDGILIVTESVFDANVASSGGAIANAYQANGGTDQGTAGVIYSTFEDNTASDGGAVSNGYQSTGGEKALFLAFFSTFADNTATSQGGSISNGYQNGGIADFYLLRSTVDAGASVLPALFNREDFSVAGSAIQGSATSLCAFHTNPFTSQGYNVEQDASSCSFNQGTDHQGLNANLLPLAVNGGTTPSEAPPANSLLAHAIPVGTLVNFELNSEDLCPNPDIDQTGNNSTGPCTIGSVDVAAAHVSPPITTTTEAPTTTTTFTSTTTEPPTTTTTTPVHRSPALKLNVYFASSSSSLSAISKRALSSFAGDLIRGHVRSFSIRGYADSTGSLGSNQRLGTLRAFVVSDYMNNLFLRRGAFVFSTQSSGGVLHRYANLSLDRVVVVKG
jgi:predicted outer membrane repeat protein